MLSRFHRILEREGRTDRRPDRIAISISGVSVLTRDIIKTDSWSAMDSSPPRGEAIVGCRYSLKRGNVELSALTGVSTFHAWLRQT